jgi:hypothetical protein
MAEKLIGPQPIIGAGDTSDVIGGQGKTTEYAPMNEAARRAIFGINPRTGKAFTEEESAAINGGYNPYAGAIGYQIDPRSGNLNILKSDGTVMTTGAKYEKNSSGNIIPQESSRPPGVGFDAEGKSYEPGERMPGESTASWIKRLSALGSGTLFENGKAIQYDTSGRFFIEGAQNQPQDFGKVATSSLQAGEALGKFTKLPSGLWQIGDGGETTSGIGFARLLARKGFDATRLPVGATLQIQPTGEVLYQGKTYLNTNPAAIKAIQDKVNKAAQAGVLAGATGQGLGRIVGGFSSSDPRDYVGMKISDVFAPESWPPGYKWDSPIPPEGIPQSRSSHVLPITKEVLGPYYESYAREYGAGGTIDFGVENMPYTGEGMDFQNMPYYGGASTQNMGFANAPMQNPFTPGTDSYKAWNERKSAYDILMAEFNRYGLGSLVAPLKGMIQSGVSPSEFTLQLRDSDAYRQRFSANQARINKGLKALSEAEYIGLEDQYQDVMRRYGMPKSYYEQRVDPITGIKTQPGFTEFISGDVSPVELEQRISTAYNRVTNANPEVGIALRTFYPDITNGDILAYSLNPERALNDIQRKITAAEIGGAAVQAGLTTNESDAAYLARYGITKEQAQQGYRTISGLLPRASQLSNIYQKQVEGGPYTQASAEREVFGTPGAAEEERKRRQITALEQAQFGGSSGLTQGALGRERAGQF